MERSLTVLVPVHDAQAVLSATVHELLDVLPELTRRFEVLIVDDGLAEATSETAHDLAHDYPQVRVVHRGSMSGREAAIRTGLEQSSGDIVVLREADCRMRIEEIRRLWQALDRQMHAAGAGKPAAHGEEAAESGSQIRPHTGFRIIDRRAAKTPASGDASQLRAEPASEHLPPPNYLAKLKRFVLGE